MHRQSRWRVPAHLIVVLATALLGCAHSSDLPPVGSAVLYIDCSERVYSIDNEEMAGRWGKSCDSIFLREGEHVLGITVEEKTYSLAFASRKFKGRLRQGLISEILLNRPQASSQRATPCYAAVRHTWVTKMHTSIPTEG